MIRLVTINYWRLNVVGKVEFEEQLRQEERVNQYQRSVVFSSFLPSSEDKTSICFTKKSESGSLIIFLFRQILTPRSVSSTDIDAYYNSHKEEFKTPAKVKLQYLRNSAAGYRGYNRIQ